MVRIEYQIITHQTGQWITVEIVAPSRRLAFAKLREKFPTGFRVKRVEEVDQRSMIGAAQVRLYGCTFHRRRDDAICTNAVLLRQEVLDHAILHAISEVLDERILDAAVNGTPRSGPTTRH